MESHKERHCNELKLGLANEARVRLNLNKSGNRE